MGLSVAQQLAAKGANIILVSRNVGKLESAVTAVKVRPRPMPLISLVVPC